MSEDGEDDWFEKALREGEATDAGTDSTKTDSEESDSAEVDSDEADAAESDEGDAVGGADAVDDESRETSAATESDGTGESDAPDESSRPDEPDAVDAVGGFASAPREAADDFSGEDPFGEDFADAMQGAPSPGGAGEGRFGDFGGGDEFAGFGGDDVGGDGDFGDFGGSGGAGFDEEAFESDIDRIDIGIEGLDEMILGGVPRASLMAVIGSAGTGKTTFGLQFLNEALTSDGKAVYITLEESRDAVLATAEEKGWPYREYEEEDRLAVVSMDPIEMANSLDSIRDDISRLINEFGADRLVLDSVSLLEMMYDHPSKRRSEVFDFARSLKDAGVTTMLTSEASEENAYASRHGIVEYLTDAVFILQYVRPSDFRETRLAVEIQKIRDANHSRETKPYEITSDGISVYRQANIF